MIGLKKVFSKSKVTISMITMCCLLLICVQVSAEITTIIYYGSTTWTPNGSVIEVGVADNEFLPVEIEQMNNDMDSRYPSARRVATASGDYNCHSYAWIGHFNNGYWLNYYTGTGAANISKYWTDWSYQWMATRTDNVILSSYVGGNCYWNGKDHSALVLSTTKYRSKWGQTGVYEHSLGHDPYGQPINLKYYQVYKW